MDKSKYKSDFNNIQNLVNIFDVYGFIKSGSPIDEYENLTNIILSSIYNNKSKSEIKKILLNEMVENFGMENEIELNNQLENLINKAELEIKNKPSH